jgi:hypothetical protein
MNDGPPALYTATVIWSTLIPSFLVESGQSAPADLTFTSEQLVARMKSDYGFGRGRDVIEALDLLKVARLAEEHGGGWTIHYRDLAPIENDIAAALLHEYRSSANKTRPIRTARLGPAEPDDGDDRQEVLLPPS